MKSVIFLLSPANCGGRRAAALLRPEAGFELARRIRSPLGAPLGEVFSFVSGLYFRGKVEYARTFAAPPAGMPGAFVITGGRGLVPPEMTIGPGDLLGFAAVPIDLAEPRYREPLAADVDHLRAAMPAGCRVVLLGSIATSKYVELLLDFLGDDLCFPEAFIGMGDMQRGALLLRATRAGAELPYVRAAGAVRSLARTPRSRAR